MNSNRLIVSFDHLSEADFQAKAGFIVASLTGNADFPTPWPALVPTPAQLSAAFDTYRSAFHASQSRDRNRIADRIEARHALVRQLHQVASYLELAADGDAHKLASTGFEQRREGGRPAGSGMGRTLQTPQDFHVGPGPRGGTIHVEAARLAGAVAYEIQTNPGDPAADEQWTPALIVASARDVLLEDLPHGAVWTRLRGISGLGVAGPWSCPVSVMIA